jgi:hypothetical protein
MISGGTILARGRGIEVVASTTSMERGRRSFGVLGVSDTSTSKF